MSKQLNQEIVQYATSQLKEGIGADCYSDELHHELFNTDYFIVGYYEAEQWLKANVGIFQAINDVVEYEKQNFGENMTDVSSSEKLVNMWVYIEGEKILSKIKHLRECWGDRLTQEDIDLIIDELENL